MTIIKVMTPLDGDGDADDDIDIMQIPFCTKITSEM